MVLYELFSILRKDAPNAEVASFLKKAALFVMEKKGVVRSFNQLNLGPLPYKMRSNMKYHDEGRYLFMQFDGSPEIVNELKSKLKYDNIVIRSRIARRPLSEQLGMIQVVPKEIEQHFS